MSKWEHCQGVGVDITGLIDWSDSHIVPLQSFADPPDLIVPRPDNLLEGKARASDLSVAQASCEVGKKEKEFFEHP